MINKPNILFLDIETAPTLGWVWKIFKENIGINQIEQSGYTMCWAAKWSGKRAIMFESLFKEAEDSMLKEMHSLLSEADIVVHYNGDRFDLPTLNKEFVRIGLKPPSPYKSVDLLKVVKKNFRLESNKLNYVSQIFGLGKKVAVNFELWKDCMYGKRSAQRLMKKYNKQDVVLLEDLYYILLPWIKNHPNLGLYVNKDYPTCTNCGSEHVQSRGVSRTNTQEYKRFQCQDCGTWLRGRTTIITKERRNNILMQVK